MFFFSLPPDTCRELETRDLEPAEDNPQGIAASVIDLLECLCPRLCGPSLDFTKLNQHTRLCRWIVYSRATTSAMALRWVLPAGFLVFAEGAIVCGADVSWNSKFAVLRLVVDVHKAHRTRSKKERSQLNVLTEFVAVG